MHPTTGMPAGTVHLHTTAGAYDGQNKQDHSRSALQCMQLELQLQFVIARCHLVPLVKAPVKEFYNTQTEKQ
jgi:hypothetical protein